MNMENQRPGRKHTYAVDIESVAGFIAQTQKNNGEIPWCEDEKTDPWDHVEAAMGLCIGGYLDGAKRAYEWLANIQQHDGSFCMAYRNGELHDRSKDANMTAYIAVGMYHYYLVADDRSFLKRMWETLRKAIDFTLSLQAESGEIYWSISPEGKIDKMALLTGSSSIYMSLKCAVAIAKLLKIAVPEWQIAQNKLGRAILERPYLFNMTKSRYSMDWFYPILCGAFSGEDAQKRIDKYWKKFVIEGQGVRCVSDRPWVTIAETSELTLALAAMGNKMLSKIVFSWICDKKYEDGSYWCGHTYPDLVVWPDQKTTWTNGVVLMAADAIYDLTPASCLFNHQYWDANR